jgi:hypothetical protein
MIVSVKQKHIDNGDSGCTTCPIALAIQEQLGVIPQVFNDTVLLYVEQVLGEYELPDAARLFIRQFDGGSGWLQPFTFEVGKLIQAEAA